MPIAVTVTPAIVSIVIPVVAMPRCYVATAVIVPVMPVVAVMKVAMVTAVLLVVAAVAVMAVPVLALVVMVVLAVVDAIRTVIVAVGDTEADPVLIAVMGKAVGTGCEEHHCQGDG